MSFGTMPLDGKGIPMSSGSVPGVTNPVALRGSLLTFTDTLNNATSGMVTEDIIRSAIMNGMGYTVTYGQTIGGAAAGFYSLSVFNPSTSGKNILIFSLKNPTGTTNVFKTTSDPALNTAVVPANMLIGGGASALTTTVTADSAAISFPGATQIDISAVTEILSNGAVYLLPKGVNSGVQLTSFIANSASYTLNIKYVEF